MKSRRRNKEVNAWPGFVDALSSLLMVMLFMLIIFILAQFFMGQDIKGQDKELTELNNKIRALSQDLSFKEEENSSLKKDNLLVRQKIEEESNLKQKEVDVLKKQIGECKNKTSSNGNSNIDNEAIYLQLEEIRREFNVLSQAMDATDKYNEEQKAQIIEIGKRLNRALATKVSQLNKYRSEFLEDMSKIVDSHNEIKAKGDHFAFQSELLFKSGSADVSEKGKDTLIIIANQIKNISSKIPDGVNWILRVDGHTDKLPIKNSIYKSNWELSTARAVNVVIFLVEQGVPPQHITATGFGEYSPLYDGDDTEKFKINRRIEFSLTSK